MTPTAQPLPMQGIPIITPTGRVIDLTNVDPALVCIDDIAIGLANIHRWGGCTRYSVAAHSIHVSEILERQGYTPVVQMAGLLHDAHEYLLSDIPTPVKQLLNLYGHGCMQWVEAALQGAVLRALGYSAAMASHRREIEIADRIAAATEAIHLLPEHDWRASGLHEWRADVDFGLRDNLHDRMSAGIEWAVAFKDRFDELQHAIQLQQEALGSAATNAML